MTGLNALCWSLAALMVAVVLLLIYNSAMYEMEQRRIRRLARQWKDATERFQASAKEGDVGLLASNLGLSVCRVEQVDRGGSGEPRVLVSWSIDDKLVTTWVPLGALMAKRPDEIGINASDPPGRRIDAGISSMFSRH